MQNIELKHSWENPHPNITMISGQILEEKMLILESQLKAFGNAYANFASELCEEVFGEK